MIFLAFLILTSVLTLLLWRGADRRARAVRRKTPRVLIRLFLAAFYLAVASYPIVPASKILFGEEPAFAPPVWTTAAYLWIPFLLLASLALFSTMKVGTWLARRMLKRRRSTAEPLAASQTNHPAVATERSEPPVKVVAAEGPVATRMSRREALALTAALIPPVTTTTLTGVGLVQCGQFRIRRETLVVPSLPAELDGLTICHLTDLHAGNFFPADAVDRVADAANALATDLVVFTGDLIDRGLLERMPIGLRLLERLDRRHGLAVIEGNHDVQANAAEFEQQMKAAGWPLLLDEQVTFEVPSKTTPGRNVRVQFLGITWGDLVEDSDLGSSDVRPLRVPSPEAMNASVRKVAALRNPNAFPVLLAHHPHALDVASDVGLPLVLAGHTHGGQIMLTDSIGGGPLRFRYWSGVHRRGESVMSISNGLGSWFPVRINAPAEIVHLTIKRSAG